MLRISKLSDYALVIMTKLCQLPSKYVQVNDLATITKINKPTVAKLVKQLSKANLLESQRGANGGYKLLLQPQEITLAAIVTAIEGPTAVVACTTNPTSCNLANECQLQAPWQKINQAIINVLHDFTLCDLLPQTTPMILESKHE